MLRDQEIRAALDQHWAASNANDFETEHRPPEHCPFLLLTFILSFQLDNKLAALAESECTVRQVAQTPPTNCCFADRRSP